MNDCYPSLVHLLSYSIHLNMAFTINQTSMKRKEYVGVGGWRRVALLDG